MKSIEIPWRIPGNVPKILGSFFSVIGDICGV